MIKAFRERDWHLSTGISGTIMMFDVLRERDLNEMAYRIANQRDFPGWGIMLANGATTTWETWRYYENTYSQIDRKSTTSELQSLMRLTTAVFCLIIYTLIPSNLTS